jgi:hypothetical protein
MPNHRHQKAKIDKWDSIKIKAFTQQVKQSTMYKKVSYRMGENIYKSFI